MYWNYRRKLLEKTVYVVQVLVNDDKWEDYFQGETYLDAWGAFEQAPIVGEMRIIERKIEEKVLDE